MHSFKISSFSVMTVCQCRSGGQQNKFFRVKFEFFFSQIHWQLKVWPECAGGKVRGSPKSLGFHPCWNVNQHIRFHVNVAFHSWDKFMLNYNERKIHKTFFEGGVPHWWNSTFSGKYSIVCFEYKFCFERLDPCGVIILINFHPIRSAVVLLQMCFILRNNHSAFWLT